MVGCEKRVKRSFESKQWTCGERVNFQSRFERVTATGCCSIDSDSDSDALSQLSIDEHKQQEQDIPDLPKQPLQVLISKVLVCSCDYNIHFRDRWAV